MAGAHNSSDRAAFAAWIQSENLKLVDLEEPHQAQTIRALTSKRGVWLNEDAHDESTGMTIPSDMLQLHEAGLLLTGWWAGDDLVRLSDLVLRRLGQTFSSGRQISAVLEALLRRASDLEKGPGLSAGGFSYSLDRQSFFVELDAARLFLRREPFVEPPLSDAVESVLGPAAMPTYSQLESKISALTTELKRTKQSTAAATVKRGKRMLVALNWLDSFAIEKWKLTRKALLDIYEDQVLNDANLRHDSEVPTREELEGWIKAGRTLDAELTDRKESKGLQP